MSTKSGKEKFPKVVYVHIEEPGTGNEFMVCNDNIEAAATMDGRRVVGVYKLEKVVVVNVEITSNPV